MLRSILVLEKLLFAFSLHREAEVLCGVGFMQLTKSFSFEMINDQFSDISQIEHSKHRSPINFFVNVTAGFVGLLPATKNFVLDKSNYNYPNLRSR
jgi:hypothetical protein